jgi:hypothetical protein
LRKSRKYKYLWNTLPVVSVNDTSKTMLQHGTDHQLDYSHFRQQLDDIVMDDIMYCLSPEGEWCSDEGWNFAIHSLWQFCKNFSRIADKWKLEYR